jgi:hypothetical protein
MVNNKVKKLSHKSLLGQQGANLIEQILIEMGQVWRPTAVHDTGVDGTMELRDPVTEEVFNRHIHIQSKATNGNWESETAQTFVYRVREEDLNYWLRGNLPVILIVSRPTTKEAYWISINKYFQEPKIRAAKKVEFHKDQDRFDKDTLPKLRDLAIPAERGIYKPPLRKEEELVSNLLQVREFPKRLYIAETDFRRRKELIDWMTRQGIQGKREWLLKNERIFSFYDLSEYPWTEITNRGAVEDFDTEEWAASNNEDKLKEWVELLNTCLKSKLIREGIRYENELKYELFYFLPNRERKQRFFKYQSQQNETRREVVKPITNKKLKTLLCYRHSAIEAHFCRFDHTWHLEVSPTYYYTSDGKNPYRFHSDQLAGIKRLEHNESVLGQLIMWERLLTDRGDIFRYEYPLLRFDGLRRFKVGLGISDDLWLPVDEEAASEDDDLDIQGSLL